MQAVAADRQVLFVMEQAGVGCCHDAETFPHGPAVPDGGTTHRNVTAGASSKPKRVGHDGVPPEFFEG
eukprot:NODE_32526_length_357_cov_1.556522.p2 GENE.NODE_32526_length_357_cov_1.556522~~NODE_32526_length_357_cov_1.556522.p2  ORF type:complete len:68 (-),score=10.25 NODE_32526_length_357_cov_1.556522:23-226(-)